MNLIRVFGDQLHLAALVILLSKMLVTRSAAGISLKSMFLFMLVFMTRYLNLFFVFISPYNFVMKILFISISTYIVYLIKFRSPWKASYDRENDTFRVRYLIVPCAVLALLFHGRARHGVVIEIFWAFSQYLEAVAILPQIFLLEYTESYDALTSHYLFCLGMYRLMYLVHWVVRYTKHGKFNTISVIAGVVQTLLYVDFFYHYITQVVRKAKQRYSLSR